MYITYLHIHNTFYEKNKNRVDNSNHNTCRNIYQVSFNKTSPAAILHGHLTHLQLNNRIILT